jgi:TonB family protein
MKAHHTASFVLALGLHLVLVVGVWLIQLVLPPADPAGRDAGGREAAPTVLLDLAALEPLPAEAPVPAAAPQASAAQPAGDEGARETYFTRLRRHLQGFRQPLGVTDLALAAQPVSVQLGIRADGSLETLRLAGSSGDPALDAEALALVRRAAPLPPPPQAMRVIVPVSVVAAD